MKERRKEHNYIYFIFRIIKSSYVITLIKTEIIFIPSAKLRYIKLLYAYLVT